MAKSASTLTEDRIAYLEELVKRRQGRRRRVHAISLRSDVDRIVKAMVLAGLEQAQHLARLAIEETRLGVLEDKAIKNMVATEFVYNYVRDKRTVGVIREYPERGLVEVAEPIGVILSLTPDHEPHVDGAVQVHHGDQDAERGDLRPASEGVALLPRGRADHVRDRGKARRAGRRVHLPGIARRCETTST